MSRVDCESFGSIWQLLLHFFMIFREGRGPTLAVKWLQRVQKGLFTLKIYVLGSETPLRVVGWSSYFVHMKYPWVLSIARVSDQSYNFYKLFHDFQVSEGSSLAMKRWKLDLHWKSRVFTLKPPYSRLRRSGVQLNEFWSDNSIRNDGLWSNIE